MWLDLQKLTIMLHLANCILLAQLINSHTRTLPMYICINGLSWLVYFSGAGFADHMKSRLRQWGPWRALDRRCGSHIHPVLARHLLRISGPGLSEPMTSSSWTHSYILQIVLLEGTTRLQLSTHLLIHAIRILCAYIRQWVLINKLVHVLLLGA